MFKLLAVAALALYALQHRPKWLDDVSLRGFASDHIANSASPQDAEIALEFGLPLGWILDLRKFGVPTEKLEEYADKLVIAMLQLGKPKDFSTETLASYKLQVFKLTFGEKQWTPP